MNKFPSPSIHENCDGSQGVRAESAAGERPFTPAAQPTYVPVRAMEDVLRCRTDQIFRFGHTPERDAQRPLLHFAQDIENGARAILEDAQFNKPADRIRRRLVKLAALTLATIDRIDNGEEAYDQTT